MKQTLSCMKQVWKGSLFSDQTAWRIDCGESTTSPTCSRWIQTGKHSLCRDFLRVANSASTTEDNSCQAAGLKLLMTLRLFSKYLQILTFRLRWFQGTRQQGSTEALQGSSAWVRGRDAASFMSLPLSFTAGPLDAPTGISLGLS